MARAKKAVEKALKEEGDRTWQLVEVIVFLTLILPSTIVPAFVLDKVRHALGEVSFLFAAYVTVPRDLALVGLVFYFLWRDGEPFQRIGWTMRRWWLEAIWGFVLFFPVLFISGSLYYFLRRAGLGPLGSLANSPQAQGSLGYALLSVVMGVLVLSEEVIFRGYLLLRLRNLTASTTLAVILSACLFALCHAYEGMAWVLTVGTMGLLFSLAYLWRRSLVTPVVIHFLANIYSLIVYPFLLHRG